MSPEKSHPHPDTELSWSTKTPKTATELDFQVYINGSNSYPHLQHLIDEQIVQRNGQVFNLENVFVSSNDQLRLVVGLTDYKTHTAALKHPDKFSPTEPGICVGSLVITSDNQIVLGIRTDGKTSIFGGTLNTDEEYPMTHPHHIFYHMQQELFEELGLPKTETENTSLFAITRRIKNHRPLFLFQTKTNKTLSQIERLFSDFGNKDEHSAITSLEHTKSAIQEFINASNANSSTHEMLSVYTSLFLQ